MYANVRGTRLYFDVDGMGLVPVGDSMEPRPPLFLLHGGPGGDHSSFKTSVNSLADVSQLIYLDHRGSGRSAPAQAEDCTLDENIQDLEAVRSYLGLEQIAVLGSSYGGMVAQGYAIRYPEHIERLILVATAPSFRFLEEARRIVQTRGTQTRYASAKCFGVQALLHKNSCTNTTKQWGRCIPQLLTPINLKRVGIVASGILRN